MELKRRLLNQLIYGIMLLLFFIAGVVLTIVGFSSVSIYLSIFGIVFVVLGLYLSPFFIFHFILNLRRYKVYDAVKRGIMSVTTLSAMVKIKKTKIVKIIRELIDSNILVGFEFDGEFLSSKS